MSHLKHPGQKWARQLFIAGQPRFFGYVRRQERRRSRHCHNNHYRELSCFGNTIFSDADGDFHVSDITHEPEEPKRMRKEQADYLAPLWNFLRSNAGRPWADVYSKLARRTNRDSTCGDHLWLHIRGFIVNEPWRIESYKTSTSWFFYVDEYGILQHLEGSAKRKRSKFTQDQLREMAPEVRFYAKCAVPCGSCSTYGLNQAHSFTKKDARVVTVGKALTWGIPVRYDMWSFDKWVLRSGLPLSEKAAETFWGLTTADREKMTYVPSKERRK